MPTRKTAHPDPSPSADSTSVDSRAPGRPRRRSAATQAPQPPLPQNGPPTGTAPAIEQDGSWVEADAVEIHRGAAGRVDATDVAVTQGAIGFARGDRVSVAMGALGAAMAEEVTVSQGMAGSIVARHARVEQAAVRTLIAAEGHIHRPSAVAVLIARRVSGDVRVLLDWRGALAFGAAFGLLAGLFGRGRRRG